MIKLSYKKFERRVFLKNELQVKSSGAKNIKELLKDEDSFFRTLLERITEQVKQSKK